MKIALIATKAFEDDELQKPREAMQRAGHDVFVIGPKADEALAGERGRVRVMPDLGIDQADAQSFDALFIPGGFSPDQLRADKRFVRFVKEFDQADKPIFAICHGAQLLLTADVLEGRTVTAWRTVQDDLRRAGIQVRDEAVVVDDKLVTSRQPGDLPAFNEAILKVLEREESDRPAEGAAAAEAEAGSPGGAPADSSQAGL